MVKVFVLNPVTTDKWDELTLKYLKGVAFPGTEVEVDHIEDGPESIERKLDVVRAEAKVVEKIVEAERRGFDIAMINCFDDPGLHASREAVSMPVLGIGETSMTMALLLGEKFAIISTGRNSRAVYERRALEMGIVHRLAYSTGINISVLKLRKDESKVKAMILEEAKKAIEIYGAEVIVLGCSGMIGFSEYLSKKLKVPVIDPTLLTFKVAEGLGTIGLAHSKVYLYSPPIQTT